MAVSNAVQIGPDRVRLSKSGRFMSDAYEAFLVSHIRHVDNRFFGQPFVLDPWQRDYIWRPLFGQGRMEGSGQSKWFHRSKSIILTGLPRSGGKSDLACAMLLTAATMEPTADGEYAVIAWSKDQAKKDFRKLKSMIRQDDTLSELWHVYGEVIVNRETGARIMVMPYSEEALQSWHLNGCVLDEVHTYRDEALYEAVTSGQGDIPNAFTIIITTAGKQRSGFLWDFLPKFREMREAHVYWLGARDDEDIDDPRMWKRTHPMSWIQPGKIRAQRSKLTSKSFERYEINRFPLEHSAESAFNARQLRACPHDGGFDIDTPFTLGVDGAISGDTFAIVAHQLGDDGVHRFREWIFNEPGDDGYYDLNAVEQLIAGLYQAHRCRTVIDPSRLLLMSQQLRDDWGCEIYQLPQSNANMCPAADMVSRGVKGGRFDLGGCPVLEEHLSNCLKVEREPYGWRLGSDRHGQGTERIDAAIAAAIAVFADETSPADAGWGVVSI